MNGTAAAGAASPLSPRLNLQLSIMMFLQYAIWGAWLPIFYPFLTVHRAFTPAQAGNLFAIGAIGAIAAPFIAGQIADRYFNTEKFLAIIHIVGGILVWQLARVDSYGGFVVFGLLYSLVYAPTLALTNSLAFHHLPDRDRDFGKVRVWGTVGWIVVGIGVGQWLRLMHSPADLAGDALFKAQVAGMADAFRLSAILGVAMGIYCLFLPKTPPQPGRQKFAPFEALGEVKHAPLLVLFLIAFPISVVHQFYFVHTSTFLGTLQTESSAAIDRFFASIFGVGGGGLMTIGQIAEIFVLAPFVPWVAKRISRKSLLTIGLVAYILRFFVFAYLPHTLAVAAALALHGFCFGCFFFVAFMIVDEETTGDVRASAQSLFNLVIIAFGTIAGNFFAGYVAGVATKDGKTNYATLFSVPMWIVVACLIALALLYPKKKAAPAEAKAQPA
jgi:nucleoside transporter